MNRRTLGIALIAILLIGLGVYWVFNDQTPQSNRTGEKHSTPKHSKPTQAREIASQTQNKSDSSTNARQEEPTFTKAEIDEGRQPAVKRKAEPEAPSGEDLFGIYVLDKRHRSLAGAKVQWKDGIGVERTSTADERGHIKIKCTGPIEAWLADNTQAERINLKSSDTKGKRQWGKLRSTEVVAPTTMRLRFQTNKGEALGAVMVILTGQNNGRLSRFQAESVMGSDGMIFIPPYLLDEELTIHVLADRFDNEEEAIYARLITKEELDAKEIVVVIESNFLIRGRIVLPDGSPVAGVPINSLFIGPKSPVEEKAIDTATLEDGTFAVVGVHAEKIRLAGGYSGRSVDSGSYFIERDLFGKADVDLGDVIFWPKIEVEVRVTLDGKPLSKARLKYTDYRFDTRGRNTLGKRTNEQGVAKLELVSSGIYDQQGVRCKIAINDERKISGWRDITGEIGPNAVISLDYRSDLRGRVQIKGPEGKGDAVTQYSLRVMRQGLIDYPRTQLEFTQDGGIVWLAVGKYTYQLCPRKREGTQLMCADGEFEIKADQTTTITPHFQAYAQLWLFTREPDPEYPMYFQFSSPAQAKLPLAVVKRNSDAFTEERNAEGSGWWVKPGLEGVISYAPNRSDAVRTTQAIPELKPGEIRELDLTKECQQLIKRVRIFKSDEK